MNAPAVALVALGVFGLFAWNRAQAAKAQNNAVKASEDAEGTQSLAPTVQGRRAPGYDPYGVSVLVGAPSQGTMGIASPIQGVGPMPYEGYPFAIDPSEGLVGNPGFLAGVRVPVPSQPSQGDSSGKVTARPVAVSMLDY